MYMTRTVGHLLLQAFQHFPGRPARAVVVLENPIHLEAQFLVQLARRIVLWVHMQAGTDHLPFPLCTINAILQAG